jgi:hypothetical protein
MFKTYIKSNTQKLAYLFLGIYCLTFSLSIALSQIVLILFLISVVFSIGVEKGGTIKNILGYFTEIVNSNLDIIKIFYFPALCWFAVTSLSLLFGLDVRNSVLDLFRFSIYFILPILIFSLFSLDSKNITHKSLNKIRNFLYLLFIGQSIAALHTVISGALGYEIRPSTPGPLTESGQIAFILPIYFAILIDFFRNNKNEKIPFLGFFLVNCFIFNVVAWNFLIPSIKLILFPSLLLVQGLFLLICFKRARNFISKEVIFLSLVGALMLVALLVNLKRGPWFSVAFTTVVLASLYSLRKLFVTFIVLVGICLLPPIWQRLFEFREHFFISGGRFDMWKLGFQLIEIFPLGIGFSNSDMIRKFDSSLPEMHRHMHNNILNVILENGILSGVIYCWWFYYLTIESIRFIRKFNIGKTLISSSLSVLISVTIILGTIGYQLAGLVEYNFGDGEIRILFLVLVGFLFVLLKQIEISSNMSKI